MMNTEPQNLLLQMGNFELSDYFFAVLLVAIIFAFFCIITKCVHACKREAPLILSEGVYCFCPSCDYDNATAVYEYVGTADGWFHVNCPQCGLDGDRTNVSLIFPLNNPKRT